MGHDSNSTERESHSQERLSNLDASRNHRVSQRELIRIVISVATFVARTTNLAFVTGKLLHTLWS